jgi:ABC-2 type transport system ATP-binding protein
MLQFDNVTRNYGTKTAVAELNLEIPSGELFALLGPNGAGKTTAIKMIVGLLRPSSGTVRLCGYDVVQDSRRAKGLLGYVPDEPYLYEKLTGREFLHFIANMHGLKASTATAQVARQIDDFTLHTFVDELTESYSHGMKQRLAFAASLLHEPAVLVIDEPMVGLDPRSARLVKDLLVALVERGHTVFLSTHVLEIAEHLCHRVGIIDHGQVVATGTLDELRHQAHVEAYTLEDIFLQLTGGSEERELATYLRDA